MVVEKWFLTFMLVWLVSIFLRIGREEGWVFLVSELLKLVGFIGSVITTLIWIWV